MMKVSETEIEHEAHGSAPASVDNLAFLLRRGLQTMVGTYWYNLQSSLSLSSSDDFPRLPGAFPTHISGEAAAAAREAYFGAARAVSLKPTFTHLEGFEDSGGGSVSGGALLTNGAETGAENEKHERWRVIRGAGALQCVWWGNNEVVLQGTDVCGDAPE